MANLATTDVTIDPERTFTYGGPAGRKNRRITATYTNYTGGGGTNRMLATAFGLTKILWCSNLLVYTTADGSSPRVYPACPSYNGSEIFLVDAASDTETAHATPADVAVSSSQTGKIIVEGY